MRKRVITFLLLNLTVLPAQETGTLMRQVEAAIERRDWKTAEQELQVIITNDANYAPAFYQLGRIAYFQDDLVGTLEYLRKAIDLEPTNEEYRKEFDRYTELKNMMADAEKFRR